MKGGLALRVEQPRSSVVLGTSLPTDVLGRVTWRSSAPEGRRKHAHTHVVLAGCHPKGDATRGITSVSRLEVVDATATDPVATAVAAIAADQRSFVDASTADVVVYLVK